MTEEYISPAAQLDLEHHLAEIEAARVAQELAARDAPRPRITKAYKRKSAPLPAQLADEIGKAMAQYVAAKVDPLLARIAALEARKSLHDAGVWKAGELYDAGAVVSHGGSCWAAQAQSKGTRPGEGSAWRLLAKKGKDGRDGIDGKDFNPAKETRKIHAMA